jgi:hypothetical protein
MKIKKIWIMGAIALLIIILITLFFAPSNNQKQSGSTYNRKPDGYAAWYEYMLEKGINLKKWKKPFLDLLETQEKEITLLKIQPALQGFSLTEEEQNWLKKGNNLIVLGVKESPTKAKFSSIHNSDVGKIKIDTSRRGQNKSAILGDEFGAIIWQEAMAKGEITQIITSYFAANAYQDYQGNYQFLEQLVTKYNQPILIDEYLHGYQDKEVIKEEFNDNLIGYLLQTPLSILMIQGLILLGICLWSFNHRFGQIIQVSSPKINNSKAYIDALAAVLEKAKNSDFMIEIIGKEEQIQLQKKLGLGNKLLPRQDLIDLCQNQRKNQLASLSLLELKSKNRPLKERELLNWLKEWQKILNFNLKSTNNDKKS